MSAMQPSTPKTPKTTLKDAPRFTQTKTGKDVEDKRLDFSSKRTMAAMKITGIQPCDLEAELIPDDNATEKELRRFEVKEQKRRNLIAELREASASLDARDIDALISGPGFVDDNELFLVEKAKIDRQRERNRAELQRKAAWEVESQQIQIRAERDREATSRRVREQKEEKARQEQARMEQKRLRVQANIAAAKDRENKKQKRLSEKVHAREEQVSRNIESLLSARNGKVGQLQNKFDQNARRLTKHIELEKEAELQKHYNNTQRLHNVEGFLVRRNDEQQRAQMENKAHFSGRRNIVTEALATQIQEREKAAHKNIKKIEKAREHAATNWISLADGVKEKRALRLEKWMTNREAQDAETRKHVQKLRTQLNTSEARSVEVADKYREETLGKYHASRDIFLELVEDNKERIARSDEIAREHTISKINFHKACNESRQEQREQATSYRVEAFREQVHGQSQVEELHHLLSLTARSAPCSRAGLRSAPSPAVTSRVNEILTDLGVPVPEAILGVIDDKETDATPSNTHRIHSEAQGK